ncbi:MAG: hypothetical protein J7L34_01485, partial [Thermotogaceae bacterium]|nr:hypothetical protein [Thermotogaceae bacterium]
MKIAVGGFGLQGLVAIPFFRVINDLGIKAEVVASGIAGFYAILRENLDEAKAIESTLILVKKLEKDLRVVDRAGICEGERLKSWKKEAVEYCVDLSIKNGRRNYAEIKKLLPELKMMKNVYIECLDLEEYKVKLYSGDPIEGAIISLAFPGIFPPYNGKIVSTTYLTQIPLESMNEGEIVIDNLRNPCFCKNASSDEFLSQSAELRALMYAKTLIKT